MSQYSLIQSVYRPGNAWYVRGHELGEFARVSASSRPVRIECADDGCGTSLRARSVDGDRGHHEDHGAGVRRDHEASRQEAIALPEQAPEELDEPHGAPDGGEQEPERRSSPEKAVEHEGYERDDGVHEDRPDARLRTGHSR